MYLSERLLQSCLTPNVENAPIDEWISCLRIGSCFDRAIHTDPHTDRSAVDVLCRERFLRPDDAAILIHILFLPTKGLELPMDLSRERLEQLLECQRLFQLLCSAHLFLDTGRLLQLLYRRHKTFDDRAGAKRVREVCQYISEHISDYDLGVPMLSQYCGINRNLLAADFKKYTGRSLSTYLIETRVQYAKQLMIQHPDWGLSEIAARSGHASLSTMYRNFQKVAGCSPGDFRDLTNAQITE